MTNLTELKQKRGKLLTDAQHLLLDSPDAEKRSQAHKMLADADIIETDMNALERIEKFEKEERSKSTPPRPNPSDSNESPEETRSKSEKRAFENYIRYGAIDRDHLKETRDITTGSTGSNLIPQSYYPLLIESLKSYGNVLNYVTNKESDNGAPMKYGTVSDTANSLVVIAEDVAVSETDPTLSGSTISTDTLTTGVILVSFAELQDSAFSLDDFIKNSFGKRYFRGLSSMVTSGNSSNIGSMKTSAPVGATSASPTTLVWGDLAAAYASLDTAYESSAVWTMNATTRGALLAEVDTLGRPIYVIAPTSASFDMLLSKQVVINPYLDNIGATNVPVLYGDHSSYILRTVKPGLGILRLTDRYADKLAVGFVGWARAGGALVDAGGHPLVQLKCHA